MKTIWIIRILFLAAFFILGGVGLWLGIGDIDAMDKIGDWFTFVGAPVVVFLYWLLIGRK